MARGKRTKRQEREEMEALARARGERTTLREIELIEVESLHVPERLRKTTDAAVDAMAESFQRGGQETPIHFRIVDNVVINGEPTDGVPVLVAGATRLAAAKKLGWERIEALEVANDALTAQLWEIDENLIRSQLTPVEEARALALRKELYIELHPQTAAGQAQAEGMNKKLGRDVAVKNEATFVKDTAQKTGKSVSSIEKKTRRGLDIAPDVLNAVNGTPMDKGVELDALVKLDHEGQRRAVEMAKGGETQSVRAAVEIIGPRPTKDALSPEAVAPEGGAGESHADISTVEAEVQPEPEQQAEVARSDEGVAERVDLLLKEVARVRQAAERRADDSGSDLEEVLFRRLGGRGDAPAADRLAWYIASFEERWRNASSETRDRFASLLDSEGNITDEMVKLIEGYLHHTRTWSDDGDEIVLAAAAKREFFAVIRAKVDDPAAPTD